MSAKAKSLVGLPATGALLLLAGILLPCPVHAFDAKDLEGVLKGGDCPGCDLSGADLFARNLANINLSGADLSRANLSLASLKSANLSRANLNRAELASSFLFGAELTQANLGQAIMDGAYLHQANLEGAILAGADLSRSYLFDANLKGTDLKGAKLHGANLSGTNLLSANLQQASIEETIYDSTTRFPSGFDVGTFSFTTIQPKSETYEQPDRGNSSLAEIHQLSLAMVILTMGVADVSSYGGSKDKDLERAAAEINQRLVKLKRETCGKDAK
ncbi:MAG: pentapeptide repeat-containing protein [Cyanobacteriota bacterium]|nr:pentapeptide repeat-containing protein [Cyanobacteriota bacterium]